MAIDDIIDVNEINGKVSSLLSSLREHEIDIFLSPGTPVNASSLVLNMKNFLLIQNSFKFGS